MNEIDIRDRLAKALHLLEPGLTLLEIEHKLANAHGSRGSIDILARDALGHRVIIEVKRSDSSARSALHELCKYVALFRAGHGLANHRVRCFIVSTTWHELRVPFAEFVQTSDYQVEGFELTVAPDGTPVAAVRVVSPDLADSIEFSLHHDILLYHSPEHRDAVAASVADRLQTVGAVSTIVCRLDHVAAPSTIVYPYALYAVTGGIRPDVRAELENELRLEYETDDLESVGPTLVEQALSSRALQHSSCPSDTYEIGYPDKLTSVLRTGWSCVGILRRGCITSELAITDAELLVRLQGLDGSNTTAYERMATPRVLASWSDFVQSAAKCLRGNTAWSRAFGQFVRFLETKHPQSQVSARIYNPLRTPMSLARLALGSDPSYLPTIEVFASEGGGDAWVLMGVLVWTGVEPPDSIDGVLAGIVTSPMEYSILLHFGEAWTRDERLSQRLGLEYEAAVFRPLANGDYEASALVESGAEITLVDRPPFHTNSLARYIQAHFRLIIELADKLVPVSMG